MAKRVGGASITDLLIFECRREEGGKAYREFTVEYGGGRVKDGETGLLVPVGMNCNLSRGAAENEAKKEKKVLTERGTGLSMKTIV